MLRHPDDVHTVFRDSDKHVKAVDNNSGWLMGELLGNCLGLISGEPYQRVKTAHMAHFTNTRALTHLHRIRTITDNHLKRLEEEGPIANGSFNPVSDFRMLPFSVVSDILYGDQLTVESKAELERLILLREALWSRMLQGGTTRFSWMAYLPTELTRSVREFQHRWARFNDDAYQAGLQMDDKPPIVALYEEQRQGHMEMAHLLQTLDEMLFANLDVTIGGVSWCLLFLAAHPDVQNRVRGEIQRARRSNADSDVNSYLHNRQTLLAASIMESARLKPLAAFSVPQSAPGDRIVDGFNVPAGTNFVVDTHAINIENSYWGTDGEVYRPERFLERKASAMRYHFWRFGFGPRQCMGKYVVELMLRVLVANLVENYCLFLDEKASWEKSPASWILHPDTMIRCQRVVDI